MTREKKKKDSNSYIKSDAKYQLYLTPWSKEG